MTKLKSVKFPIRVKSSSYNEAAAEYANLTLKNDFMFSRVMQDRSLCRELLNRIFPELHIRNIRSVTPQKSLKHYFQNKGVRLDIYAIDQKGRRYDIEMQLSSGSNLPRRTRYYSSMMDANDLLKGKNYDTLSDSYVVFICTFDPFDKGRFKYVFRNICESDSEIQLDDGSVKVFLNTKGTLGDISPELKAFLDYVENSQTDSDDPYLKRLQAAVTEARKNETWRGEYMTYKNIKRSWFLEGREKGREEGIETGRKDLMKETVFRMLSNGRDDETIISDTGLSPRELEILKAEYQKQ